METTHAQKIQEIKWTQKSFLTVRAKVGFSGLTQFFRMSYPELYERLGKLGLKSDEAPYAIYFSVDEKKKSTDLAAAISVTQPLKDKPNEQYTISDSKALLLTYYGPYDGIGTAYEELEKYCKEHKLEKTCMLEQYFTDPTEEKDPAKWKTNIYFIVK